MHLALPLGREKLKKERWKRERIAQCKIRVEIG